MSNYLLVVSNRKAAANIESWLGKYSSNVQAELMQLELEEDRWLTYVSRDPSLECRLQDGFIFKGYAIDYARESIAFGAEGFAQYLSNRELARPRDEPLEGCYVSAHWGQERVEISSDFFSLCPVLYFSEKSIVAISDSTYVLASLRRALGFRCRLHERAVIARSWSNGMAGQMLSNDTLVEEIKYAPVGTTLAVSLLPRINLHVKRRNVPGLLSLDTSNYVDGVRRAAQRVASSVGTFAGISTNAARLALSGGLDSRVCLAAALLTEAGREQAVFNCISTNSSHVKDYQVASSLSEKFGFPLGGRPSTTTARGPVQAPRPRLEHWFLSNCGIYDFMYITPSIHTSPGAVSIGGHGAEVIKGNYGWRQLNAISARIADTAVAEAFLSQCEEGVAAMGVAPGDAFGSEWHYLGYRNAIHSGRFVTGTMTGFRPLMTRSLVAMSRSNLNEWMVPKKGGQSLISDLLVCLSPALAAHPFDENKKSLADSYVQERVRYLGGALGQDEIVSYKVMGSLSDVVNGSANILSELLAQTHGAHQLERSVLLKLTESSFERLTGNVRKAYRPVREEALMDLANQKLEVEQMRAAVGKLLSFELVD